MFFFAFFSFINEVTPLLFNRFTDCTGGFCRLEISIEMIYSKIAGKTIPMLSVIDDGHGMTHEDVVRMTSLGHKAPDEDDTDRIGRFGVGFKVRGSKYWTFSFSDTCFLCLNINVICYVVIIYMITFLYSIII